MGMLELGRVLLGKQQGVISITPLDEQQGQVARVSCATREVGERVLREMTNFPIGKVQLTARRDPDCPAWTADELWSVWVEPVPEGLEEVLPSLAKANSGFHSHTYKPDGNRVRGTFRFVSRESAELMVRLYDQREVLGTKLNVFPDPKAKNWKSKGKDSTSSSPASPTSITPAPVAGQAKRITFYLSEAARKRDRKGLTAAMPWPTDTYRSVQATLERAGVNFQSLQVFLDMRCASVDVVADSEEAFRSLLPLPIDTAGACRLEARQAPLHRIVVTCTPHSKPTTGRDIVQAFETNFGGKAKLVPIPQSLKDTLSRIQPFASTRMAEQQQEQGAQQQDGGGRSEAHNAAKPTVVHDPHHYKKGDADNDDSKSKSSSASSETTLQRVFVLEITDTRAAHACVRRRQFATSVSHKFVARLCYPNDVHVAVLDPKLSGLLSDLVEAFNKSSVAKDLDVLAAATTNNRICFTSSTAVLVWSQAKLLASFLAPAFHPFARSDRVLGDDKIMEHVLNDYGLKLVRYPTLDLLPYASTAHRAMRDVEFVRPSPVTSTPPIASPVAPQHAASQTATSATPTTTTTTSTATADNDDPTAVAQPLWALYGFGDDKQVADAMASVIERSANTSVTLLAMYPHQFRHFAEVAAMKATIMAGVTYKLDAVAPAVILRSTDANALRSSCDALAGAISDLVMEEVCIPGSLDMLREVVTSTKASLLQHVLLTSRAHERDVANRAKHARPTHPGHGDPANAPWPSIDGGKLQAATHVHHQAAGGAQPCGLTTARLWLVGAPEHVQQLRDYLLTLECKETALSHDMKQALIHTRDLDGAALHAQLQQRGAMLLEYSLYYYLDQDRERGLGYINSTVGANIKSQTTISVTGMQYRFLDSQLLELARKFRVYVRKPSAEDRDACASSVPVTVEGMQRQLTAFDNAVQDTLKEYLCHVLGLPVIDTSHVPEMSEADVTSLKRKLFNDLTKASRTLCRSKDRVVSYVAPQDVIGTPTERNVWMVAGRRDVMQTVIPTMESTFRTIAHIRPTRYVCQVPMSVAKDLLDSELERLRSNHPLTGVLETDNTALFDKDKARCVLVQSLRAREADDCKQAIENLQEHAIVQHTVGSDMVERLTKLALPHLSLKELDASDLAVMARAAMDEVNTALAANKHCSNTKLKLVDVEDDDDDDEQDGVCADAGRTASTGAASANSAGTGSFEQAAHAGETSQQRAQGTYDSGRGDSLSTSVPAHQRPKKLVLEGPRKEMAAASEVLLTTCERLFPAKVKQAVWEVEPYQYHTISETLPAVQLYAESLGVIVRLLKEAQVPRARNVRRRVRRKAGTLRVEIREGSIINDRDMNAIVNSANPDLMNDGGVAFAISQAAGTEFDAACKDSLERSGPLRCNEARVTTSGALALSSNIEHVLHMVAPNFAPEFGSTVTQTAADLKTAYRALLTTARDNNIRSLATCALGCGAFRCSPYASARALFEVIDEVDRDGTFFDTIRVTIITEDVSTLSAFKQTFEKYYGEKVGSGLYEDLQRSALDAPADETPDPIHTWLYTGPTYTEPPSKAELDNKAAWNGFTHDATLLIENAFNKYRAAIAAKRKRSTADNDDDDDDDDAGNGGDGDDGSDGQRGSVGKHKGVAAGGVAVEHAREMPNVMTKPCGCFPDKYLHKEHFKMSEEEAARVVADARATAAAEDERNMRRTVDPDVLQRWLEYKNRKAWKSARFFKFKIQYTTNTPGKLVDRYFTVDFQDHWVYVSPRKEHVGMHVNDLQDSVTHVLACDVQEDSNYAMTGGDADASTQAGTAHPTTSSSVPLHFGTIVEDGPSGPEKLLCVFRGMEHVLEQCKAWTQRHVRAHVQTYTLNMPRSLDLSVIKAACDKHHVQHVERELSDGRVQFCVAGHTPEIQRWFTLLEPETSPIGIFYVRCCACTFNIRVVVPLGALAQCTEHINAHDGMVFRYERGTTSSTMHVAFLTFEAAYDATAALNEAQFNGRPRFESEPDLHEGWFTLLEPETSPIGIFYVRCCACTFNIRVVVPLGALAQCTEHINAHDGMVFRYERGTTSSTMHVAFLTFEAAYDAMAALNEAQFNGRPRFESEPDLHEVLSRDEELPLFRSQLWVLGH
ncbi:hypothetical protein, variant [Salpingoeca rosetta]|nr:hypothetical protein, variant [Salpingoeca rosetta]EGD81981.1 hypothetical protein, variant [Salpingoeca rosetta]|eukprot:XP_004996164.1 hypothetical protein, variant [Salpingoeca rosetta]